MGLFGSIGKFLGGAAKVVGKVAGVASAVAPIPGLGFVGKGAGALGKLISRGQTAVRAVPVPPGVIASLSPIMPGGSRANQSFFASGYAGSGAGPGGTRSPMAVVPATVRAASSGRKTKRKRYTRRRTSARKRRRGGRRRLSPAQLRAGFGGKRRMRRR